MSTTQTTPTQSKDNSVVQMKLLVLLCKLNALDNLDIEFEKSLPNYFGDIFGDIFGSMEITPTFTFKVTRKQ